MSTSPVLFFDHLITPSNPYTLAVFSHWYPSSFYSPPLDLSPVPTSGPSSHPATSTTATSNPDSPESLRFSTAEHWMMYHKAALFEPSACGAILAAETPEQARDLGRKIRGFDRDIWAKHADRIVEEGNYRKFSLPVPPGPHPPGDKQVPRQDQADSRVWRDESEKRQEALFKTQGRRLVECNPNDRIWGIGFSIEDAIAHQAEWGQNRMGDALGRARDRLIREKGDDRDDAVAE